MFQLISQLSQKCEIKMYLTGLTEIAFNTAKCKKGLKVLNQALLKISLKNNFASDLMGWSIQKKVLPLPTLKNKQKPITTKFY